MSTQCLFTWSPIMGCFSFRQGKTYLSFIFRSALLNQLPRVNKPAVILITSKGKSSNYRSGKKMLFYPPLEGHSASLRPLKSSKTAHFPHISLLADLGCQHWRSPCYWHTTTSRPAVLAHCPASLLSIPERLSNAHIWKDFNSLLANKVKKKKK